MLLNPQVKYRTQQLSLSFNESGTRFFATINLLNENEKIMITIDDTQSYVSTDFLVYILNTGTTYDALNSWWTSTVYPAIYYKFYVRDSIYNIFNESILGTQRYYMSFILNSINGQFVTLPKNFKLYFYGSARGGSSNTNVILNSMGQ